MMLVEESPLPEPETSDEARRWLEDSIVSVSQRVEDPLAHSGQDFRLDRTVPFLRLQFASIFVSDQERSLRFFVDKLGFTLVLDARFASGNRFLQVAPPDGTASLAIVTPSPELNEETLVGRSGMVTFLTEDVEATYRAWSERGVHFTIPPQKPSWGGVFCRFQDPDGNFFSLAGFDEATQEIERQRQAHAERLETERRAAQELEIAKQVQARLFPQDLPLVPGLDYAGVCMQARSVGGDYYDFLDLSNGRIALVIGDIAGKGIAAALLMANLQANLRGQCVSSSCHPEVLLNAVNRLLFANTTTNAYATLFFSEYDPETGVLRYANCGHLAALVLRADGTVDRLETTCTVMGLFYGWECAMAESRLDAGDILVQYTDGVTESFNEEGEEFGDERLVASLRRNCHLPAQQLACAIADEVVSFSAREQFDDITLIVARRAAVEEPDPKS
jgi:serine phosphatase RsbU (regulator of sigma subunit)/catechol 2,3-dioxygenase-like lactoylglutathione lyase family enzyme